MNACISDKIHLSWDFMLKVESLSWKLNPINKIPSIYTITHHVKSIYMNIHLW